MNMRQHEPFHEGVPYVANHADLLANLEGQEGSFEVIYKNQVFIARCEDIPGHSPVLTSLTPSGEKEIWLITKQNTVAAEGSTEQGRYSRERAAASGR